MILVWIIFSLTPLATLGRQVKNPQTPETTYSIDAIQDFTGDKNLCIVIGGVIGTYTGGGSLGDVYEWKITNSTGEEVLNKSGGDQFETIQFLYSAVGEYVVTLKIRRGTNTDFFSGNLTVKVQKGPNLILKSDYLLCGDDPVLLTALSPNTPNLSDYTITWKSLDEDGNQVVIGTGNEFLTYSAGYHFVELYLTNPDGTEACSIQGTTFVGPPIDFQIIQSAEQICEGNSILIGTDTPLTGEWFIKKSTELIKKSLGNAFEITVVSSELTGPGLYEVFFSAEDEEYPNCSSVRKITFELLGSPNVDIQVLVSPDDCISDNGSFQITVNTEVDSIEIPELGIVESPLSSGQVLTYSNLTSKVYSVIITQNSCKTIQFVQLDSSNAPVGSNNPNQIKPEITTFPETCTEDGVAKGRIKVDFGQAIGVGEYRLLSSTKGQIESGNIPTNGLLTLDVPFGKYLLELVIDGCSYPTETFTITDQPHVKYSIPGDFLICETFDFTPETEENLLFTLTYPDGRTQALSSGNAFTITQGGNYILSGAPVEASSSLCSLVEKFNVSVLQTFTFEPIKEERGCFAPILFVANINGLLPEETRIRWINSGGEIVGRGVEFYPATIGFFSLLVQPLSSGFCDVLPVIFEVVPPVISVPVDLETTKICPEPGSVLVTLTTDELEVFQTEWIYFDLNNQRKELPEFGGQFEITVSEPGTYEVVVYNKLLCEIGRNLILVEESTLLTLPELVERYPMCSKKNNLSPIDPGNFAKYEWFFQNKLVSTERLYKPAQIGEYQLLVTTEDGCEFRDSFTAYDVCDYKVVYPNAMILGNPDQDFRVLMSEEITEAELFILNRQGELIYHATANDIKMEVPVLNWNGKAHGKNVQTGNYVVVIFLRNPLYGIEEKLIGTLLILD
ncbi:hypothetical protein LV84_00620 [Algoriphagus ratkowskyi]|nr:hypothetical protein LV84_00620 [Algoriphagus ratkowskyi]